MFFLTQTLKLMLTPLGSFRIFRWCVSIVKLILRQDAISVDRLLPTLWGLLMSAD